MEEEAVGAVLCHVIRAEHRGEAAKAAPPPQVDLPQPVARRVEALRDEGVVVGGGVDVRHTPCIDEDLHGPLKPRDLMHTVRQGRRAGGVVSGHHGLHLARKAQRKRAQKRPH